MKVIHEMLYGRGTPVEYSRIPHVIYLTDFDTNHPNPNRIERIASEINEYLRYKNKNSVGVK